MTNNRTVMFFWQSRISYRALKAKNVSVSVFYITVLENRFPNCTQVLVNSEPALVTTVDTEKFTV